MSIRVCSFESRRCQEMVSLITKFGGVATVAPSMREIPLTENQIAGEFAGRLVRGEIPIVIFMTGIGAATLFAAIKALELWEPAAAELNLRTIIIRGPKPVPILKEHGIHIDYRAPEPNTWKELVSLIDASEISLAGQDVAVQEYGKPSLEFYQALESRGARVYPVPVYRWDFPEDVGPLHAAIRESVAHPFDLMLFTSANQVDNVLAAAEQINLLEPFRQTLEKTMIASIGPTCSDRLRELGFTPAMEPSHPKMAHLVRESLELRTRQQAN
ncbi:MAG: uroporphyrinogen-III synthase [Planctomycetaceae bacterium]|nr:uroporphyrinogen-III synthase [Planctomycetaceae bacterium]